MWTEESVKEKLPEVTTELDLVDALNCLLGVKRQDLNELRNYFRNSWFKGKLPLIWHKEGQPDEIAYPHRISLRTALSPKSGHKG